MAIITHINKSENDRATHKGVKMKEFHNIDCMEFMQNFVGG